MTTAVIVSFLFLLAVALAGGLWVGLALVLTGAVTLALYRDMDVAAFLAGDIWRSLNAPELAALPLFILMGEILFRSRLSEDLFAGLAPLARRVPGGLFHINVAGATLFAAVSGSSAATTATVGRMTLPELARRGYDRDLAMGSLAGAGTLGFLIPPSIILILYGVLAEVSIVDLFIAGITPGLLLAALYGGFIALRCVANPSLTKTGGSRDPIGRAAAALKLAPILGLIIVVLGAMYLGYAGPTEAAVIGVGGALLLAALGGGLTRATLREIARGSVRTTSMIGLIIAGAFFLTRTVELLGLPALLVGAISSLELPPLGVILVLLLFYAALGMILDGLSIIVMTLPLALPLVLGAGFDPIWFGVFLVIVVEMSQVTPPIGFNLFVIESLTGARIGRIARAAFPFFLLMAGLALIITLFPQIVLWPLS